MEKLNSRKLWMAVAAGIVVVLNDGLGWGLDRDTVLGFVGIVVSYIVGQSAVDHAAIKKNSK